MQPCHELSYVLVVYHVQVSSGGVFTGETAVGWNLSREQLQDLVLDSRAAGKELWFQEKGFEWANSRIQIFEGPPTAEIEDFSALLGPVAYELQNEFTDVTGEFITGPVGGSTGTAEPVRRPAPGKGVFLVHGRNVARRERTARVLEKTLGPDHTLTILDEQANRGQVLLEKLEASAADAGFAVVLFTGDDEGRLASAAGVELQMRARQNVVLELGYFCGLLGRKNVVVLYEAGVEPPSDVEGLVYVPLDEHEGWIRLLIRELKAANIDVDINRLD